MKKVFSTATIISAFAGATFAQTNTGSADMSRYVSLGDSLTAAFSSGSLHVGGQLSSYPQLISEQARGLGAPFEQPFVTDPGLPPVLTLRALSPVTIAPKSGAGSPINLGLQRPYDNLAVPGARVGNLVRTVSDSGGLHDLILRGLGTQLEQAIGLQPTFVTIFIGSNDVLAAVGAGMVIEGETITPLASFEADYQTMVGALQANGVTAGALATIASVTSIPFVTTVPPVLVDPATSQPVVVNGNFVPLLGPDGPLGPGDFVLLTATGLLAQGVGVPAAFGGTGNGLPDQVVLSASEAAQISARTTAFNTIIRNTAASAGFALVETDRVFDEIRQNGLLLGGVRYTTDLVTGGLFSLDGVHPSPMGYAIVANAFIDSINAEYGAEIANVNLASFALSGRGALPGSTEIDLGAIASSQVLFSKSAFRNLRFGLGIPKIKKLVRLKRKAERKAGKSKVRKKRRTISLPEVRLAGASPQIAPGLVVSAR